MTYPKMPKQGDATVHDLALRESQALWYAWGQQDAGTVLRGDAFKFASAYGHRFIRFNLAGGGFMPSMQDAFKAWQAGEQF